MTVLREKTLLYNFRTLPVQFILRFTVSPLSSVTFQTAGYFKKPVFEFHQYAY